MKHLKHLRLEVCEHIHWYGVTWKLLASGAKQIIHLCSSQYNHYKGEDQVVQQH